MTTDPSLVWVSDDSTVLVTRYEDGSVMYVVTRTDSDAIWGPPVACRADAETMEIMGLASASIERVKREMPGPLERGGELMGPGIHTMSAAEYHRDPAERPSLSASIAQVMLTRSPLHAYTIHPQLGGQRLRDATEDAKFSPGTVAHALLLQGEQITIGEEIFRDTDDAVRIVPLVEVDGKPFAYVPDVPDWRTGFAKQVRVEAHARGLVALLQLQWLQVQEMVAYIRVQLDALDVDPPMFTDGKAEQTLIWEEPNGIICRARLDWLRDDLAAIDDCKTTARSGNPHEWTRNTLWSIGADIEAAFHRRGVRALTGRTPEFRFLVCETTPPFAVCPITLAPDALALADEKVEKVIATWARCLETGIWPGYPTQLCHAEMPPWTAARWMERQAAEEMGEEAIA